MKLFNKIFKRFGYGIIGAIVLLSIIIWSLCSPIVTSDTDKAEYSFFHENWSQVIGAKNIELDNIKNFKAVPKGDRLVFSCTLPEIEQGDVLLFYSNNQEVRAYVNGQVVQSFTMNEGYEILKTPGSAWNQIDLSTCMSGKTLVLSFYNPIAFYNNQLNDIYFIKNTDVDIIRINHIWFRSFVAMGLVVLSIITFANARLWKNIKRKKYFYAAGHIYLFELVILLANLGFFEIFFARPILSFLLEQIFMRIMPIAIWFLAINSTNKFRYPKMIKSLKMIAVINATIPIFLQFALGISFLETVWFHSLSLFVMMIILIVNIILKLNIFKKLSPHEYPSLALGLIFLGIVTDMVSDGFNVNIGVFHGICSVIANILYLIVVYTIFIKQDSKLMQEKAELEESYKKLKNTSLTKQINVHFIFNALNSISALCKVNPEKADEGIVTFSTYLRSYINHLDEEESIHITQELDLVENYLMIEKMRFGDLISYSIDIDFDDFDIPPFTVQTLVENAVIHGILKNKKQGEITITTKKKGDFAQITVADNGVGFDTNQKSKSSSIGLNNVKKRLEFMLNGNLEIKSKEGVGTIAIVTVPIEDDY